MGDLAEVKKPSNNITCDICHREVALTKDLLEEKEVVLEKAGVDPQNVVLTILTCPMCGKSYPVLMDDSETSAILEELKTVVQKQYKAQAKGIQPKAKVTRKQQSLRNKLNFKRQQLAKKFDGSFYQTEDGKEQLDYHYHV